MSTKPRLLASEMSILRLFNVDGLDGVMVDSVPTLAMCRSTANYVGGVATSSPRDQGLRCGTEFACKYGREHPLDDVCANALAIRN